MHSPLDKVTICTQQGTLKWQQFKYRIVGRGIGRGQNIAGHSLLGKNIGKLGRVLGQK